MRLGQNLTWVLNFEKKSLILWNYTLFNKRSNLNGNNEVQPKLDKNNTNKGIVCFRYKPESLPDCDLGVY